MSNTKDFSGPCVRIDTDLSGDADKVYAYMGLDTDEGIIGTTLLTYDLEEMIETLDKIWPNWWDGDQEERRQEAA